MTDEELKELVAANSRAVAANSRAVAANSRAVAANNAEIKRVMSRLEALHEEGERQWQQIRDEIRASRVETDRLMKAVHRDLGRLGNKFGDYTEGLCHPALSRILRERFDMTQVARRVRVDRNGKAIELDMLGHANDRINKAYVAEIKTTLRQDAIDQILEHLRVFPKFFPHHRGKELYGILAAIHAPPEEQKKVFKEGIYLVLVSEETFQICEPEGFKPRVFPNS